MTTADLLRSPQGQATSGARKLSIFVGSGEERGHADEVDLQVCHFILFEMNITNTHSPIMSRIKTLISCTETWINLQMPSQYDWHFVVCTSEVYPIRPVLWVARCSVVQCNMLS